MKETIESRKIFFEKKLSSLKSSNKEKYEEIKKYVMITINEYHDRLATPYIQILSDTNIFFHWKLAGGKYIVELDNFLYYLIYIPNYGNSISYLQAASFDECWKIIKKSHNDSLGV